MKKSIQIILAFSLIFVLLQFLPKAKAEIYIGNAEDNKTSFEPILNKKLNILKGLGDPDSIVTCNSFYYIDEDLQYFVESGNLQISAKIQGTSEEAVLDTYYTFNDCSFTMYQAFINGVEYYRFTMGDSVPTIVLCKEMDLYSILGYDEDNFILENKTIKYNCQFTQGYEPDDDEFLSCLRFDFLRAMIYKRNDIYGSKEIHFVTQVSNPLTLEQIRNSIEVTDLTDGEIKDFVIYDNTYILVNNKISVGTYSFKIRAIDYAGNTTIQECFVDVVDILAPEIQVTNCVTSYSKKIINLFSYVDVTDDSEFDVEIVENVYSEKYNIPGEYHVKFRAWDEYGNEAFATVKVTVRDDIAPIIVYDKNPTISTQDNYALEDIRSLITIHDECDGDIEDYSLIDEDLYLNNTKKAGQYRFLIEATDRSNNRLSKEFILTVLDMDYPEIRTPEYTIIVADNHTLTKEEILTLLKKVGQIQTDNISISTDYVFNETGEEMNEAGIYTLNIIDENGNHFNNRIEVIMKDTINYEPVLVKPKKDHTTLFLILGIVGVSILIMGGFGVILYKKKH